MVLLVWKAVCVVSRGLLAEGEATSGDVLAVIIVESCSTDMFIQLSFDMPYKKSINLYEVKIINPRIFLQVPPSYSGLSGVSSIFASFTITCKPR